MKVYLVGGAVRDGLLGLPIKDHDWVVVGTTPEEMLRSGFQQVGKDFPVFLHPDTHEEYALARTERKSSIGYTGFECYASADVTLEEDLLRRDLTINAIAFDFELFKLHYPSCLTPEQAIKHCKTLDCINETYFIDPYHGIDDLTSRTLKHVSDAFIEDPLRVLRLARFKAKFADMQFNLAAETQKLINKMVINGELNTLTKERIWQETHRALETNLPSEYFRLLGQCGAFEILYPNFNAAITAHSLACLDDAAKKGASLAVCFAVLLYPLFDIDTNHSLRDKKRFNALFDSLRIGKVYKDMVWLIANHYTFWMNLDHPNAEEILTLFESLAAFKHPQLINDYCFMCTLIYHSSEVASSSESKRVLLVNALESLNNINIEAILASGIKGIEIKEAITQLRLQTLRTLLQARVSL
ncbi:tRNA nucleotidyltransferase (CCA-adding enzyme) [Thorsellia anophelis DSM 18579]|uniref:tRNA nucleotidyltransferase (CCA-adding enzyme) n=1 Tax=Thorsellia anophelis DSM 18579 TaxID=1123402 RepID=A0A1H9YCV0_9GAMM|nr:hypothetical protein [Thorsellia anophelis]SES66704.1 tRNA nucleotidyltransferase (CCA-adding enzyme) [Thorsellia anophelis DSM 18579]